MAYSQVGIVNLSLGKIGVKRIASIDEDSDQAVRAKAAWEYIRNEVLEAADWSFAKTRKILAKSTTVPLYTWNYAYPLPNDYLRLAKGTKTDPRVYPSGYPFIIETLPEKQLALLTNYNNTAGSLFVNYIRIITDSSKYSPTFITMFSFRLAAELAIPMTEGMKKFEAMMTLYERWKKRAEGVLNSQNDLADEMGSDSWEDAGHEDVDLDWRAEIVRSS